MIPAVLASPAAPPAARLTAADYRRLTPAGEPPWYELIDGALYQMASPARKHQRVVGKLLRLLMNHETVTGHGETYVARFDVQLDDENVFQPDVCWFSPERARDFLKDGGAYGPPNLVVEVISPSSALKDKEKKRRACARHGVEEFWLVDPILEQVQVYRFAENLERPVAFLERGDTLATALLPGLEIALAEVFGAESSSPTTG